MTSNAARALCASLCLFAVAPLPGAPLLNKHEGDGMKTGENSEAKAFIWKILPEGTKGAGAVRDTAKGCVLSLEGTGHLTAMAECDLKTAAQRKLVFRYKGRETNGAAFLTPVICVASGSSLKSVNGPALKVSGKEFKTAVLGLNTDFQLSDATWSLRQVKLVLNVRASSSAEVEIEDFRLADPEDVAGSSGKDIAVCPAPKEAEAVLKTGLAPLKVFFDFDNDDFKTQIESRTAAKKAIDNVGGSFQAILLESCGGLFAAAGSPEEADAIVYARAAASPFAGRIAEAVAKGAGLLVYGAPQDDSIADLCPLSLEKLASKGWESRASLDAASAPKGHGLFSGESFAQGDFGVYFKSSDANRGRVILRFSDGSPALAEAQLGRGKTLQALPGIGESLFRSEAFYDRFALKALCWLAGRDDIASAKALERLELHASAMKGIERASSVISVFEAAGLLRGKDAFEKLRALRSKLSASLGTLEELGAAKAAIDAIADANCGKDGLTWQPGASMRNFGRFGWLFGEGLCAGGIGRDLTVSNGEQSFRLDTGSDISLSLSQWSLRALSGEPLANKSLDGSTRPYGYSWEGVGTVDCRCKVLLKEEWRGREISLSISDGIDDVDKTFFNGELIGETSEKVASHWQAPRRYTIPQELVKWGDENELSIEVGNLRGGARINSCPKLLLSQPGVKERAKACASSIDWTHKTYEVSSDGMAYSLTLSLLSPYVLYEIPNLKSFRLGVENIATHASWKGPDGVKTVELSKAAESFYGIGRDGRWTAPWLLLWRAQEGKPLLLAFKRQPEALLAKSSAGFIDSIEARVQREGADFCAGWPFGVDSVDCSSWTQGIPPSIAAKLDASCAMALNYPVSCYEAFAIDKEKGRVRIMSALKFHPVDDEWQTPKRPFALLPPLAGFSLDSGAGLVESKGASPIGDPTKYGPLYGAIGKASIEWSLPLPDRRDFLFASVKGEERLQAQIDEIFAGGARWSCGGRLSVDAWTPEKPAGSLPARNIDPFAWSFGMTSALQGYFTLSQASREILAKRLRARFTEPLELHQYKNFARHRIEPFSGLRYPILFNSYYPNNASYAPGFGSSVVYGDSNEACAVPVWIARMLGDAFGRPGLVRSNWSYFKYLMDYMLQSEDWAFNSGSCRESGAGAWIDMLDCEYPLMRYYADIADMAGDKAASDDALYRAAKRMLPTLLRLRFKDYASGHKLSPASQGIAMVTGFSEDSGPVCLGNPPSGGNFHSANDLFDFSQGFCGSLRALYLQKEAANVRAYVNGAALPALAGAGGKFAEAKLEYLPPLAFFAESAEDLRKAADAIVSKERQGRMNDWPGIRIGSELGAAIWRLNGRFDIAEFKELSIEKAAFDPASGTALLEFKGLAPNSKLAVSCGWKLLSAEAGGKPLSLAQEPDGLIRLPVSLGESKLLLRFEEPSAK